MRFRPDSCDSSVLQAVNNEADMLVSMRVIIQYIFLYIDMNAQVHKIQDVWYVTRKGNKKYHVHLRGELSGEPNGLSNLFRRRSSSCCSVNAFCL